LRVTRQHVFLAQLRPRHFGFVGEILPARHIEQVARERTLARRQIPFRAVQKQHARALVRLLVTRHLRLACGYGLFQMHGGGLGLFFTPERLAQQPQIRAD